MAANPMTETDLRQEQHRIYRSSAAAFLLCAAILGGAHIVLPRLVQLPGPDLEARLAFWAGANLFLVVWVMIGVGMVSHGRRHSAEDISGSAYSHPSPKIAVAVAFLQNTLEQFVLASFALFALMMLLGAAAMPFIAASVLLFGIGRTTFLLGYPKGAGGRAFGMAVTTIPTAVAFVLALGALVNRIWR
jgi:hypothetical protein